MKKVLIISAVLILGLAPHVFADGFVPLAEIPGLTSGTEGSVVNSATLATFLNNLYKYLIGIAAVLAVIEITWAGIRIAANQDNVGVITDSKGHIYNAIFGLILILAPALVFGIINPSILNLSINLPPINTLTTNSDGSQKTGTDSRDLPTCGSAEDRGGSCVNRDATQQAAYDALQQQNKDANQIGPGYDSPL
jgi:hypothetical protein